MNFNKIKQSVSYWGQLLLLPVLWFSYITPRNRRLWLFGSTFGRRFAENPRYLFLYVKEHEKELGLRPVWISHNKRLVEFLNKEGYEAYYYLSVKGILLGFTAGVYLFDNYSKDISFWTSGGAIKVNLWHGSGNKQTNHDNMHDAVRHPKTFFDRIKTWPRRLSDEKPSHYTLATSDMMSKIFASAFNTDISHILVNGLPRNDTLFFENTGFIQKAMLPEERELSERLKNSGKKIIAYLPTFRESEGMFFDVMDLQAFDSYLKERGYIFLVKLHPKSRIGKAFDKIKGDNIISASPETDVYSFLRFCDMLVSDYSSVYTDYMLTDRPVVAFTYDEKEYLKDTREYYFTHEEYMPERRAVNMQQLMQQIDEAFENDTCREARALSRDRMFKWKDGNSCPRMIKLIKNIYGE